MIAILVAATLVAAPDCRPAYLLSVTDGDSVHVMHHVGQSVWFETSIRVAGVDAPETGRLAMCDKEREKGKGAAGFSRSALASVTGFMPTPLVRICNVRNDKFAGRMIADVEYQHGSVWRHLGRDLVAGGHAQPYSGGKKPEWCAP